MSGKPFLPRPPEGYRWHVEEGRGYKFHLSLRRIRSTDLYTKYNEYANFERTLPWAARRILRAYRRDHDTKNSGLLKLVNETDWGKQ